MFTIQRLAQPDILEEAYGLLTEHVSNTILGGGAFLRLGSKKIQTAIDLSKLGLQGIQEKEGYVELGAMTTFRAVETSQLLKKLGCGVLPQAVSPIIGVQFRNVVTVGATVYSKYGFSDLLTALLALDTEVELYQGGRMTLEEFLAKPSQRDILTKVYIQQNARQASYQSMRNSASDYPILNAAVSRLGDSWRIVVGARPLRAALAVQAAQLLGTPHLTDETITQAAQQAAEELSFGSNLRGSADYRRAICKVLVERGIREVLQCK